MARRYPPQVTDAIWALLCERVPTAEILRRLNAGEAPGCDRVEPPMPRRTLNDKIAALKRDRGLPAQRVNPGREAVAAGAIKRRLLEALGREEARLTAASRSRALTPREIDALARAAKTAAEIERREARPEPEPVTPEHPSPSPLLAQLEAEARDAP